MDIVRNITEDRAVTFLMTWLRRQWLDLDTLHNRFLPLWFSVVKDGTEDRVRRLLDSSPRELL